MQHVVGFPRSHDKSVLRYEWSVVLGSSIDLMEAKITLCSYESVFTTWEKVLGVKTSRSPWTVGDPRIGL